MNLKLSIHGNYLSLVIMNSSVQERRLWEWSNSWGWFTLAIQVRGKASTQIEARRKLREWTKNGPVYFTLRPQERREVKIDLHDGWWELENLGGAPESWQNDALELRARLQIERTPESDQFDVFTGTVVSEWIKSKPPHRWLLTQG